MKIKNRPLCMVFLTMMLIILLMHISGLPLPGTFSPPDEITNAVSADESIRVSGRVSERHTSSDGTYYYIISDSYLTDDPSVNDLRNIKLYIDESASVISVGSDITVYGKISLNETASNPGQFDAYTYYAAADLWMAMSVKKVVSQKEPVCMAAEYAASLRERLNENIMKLLGEDSGAVISAMILGDKSGLSYELRSGYTVTGLSHLLAISGLHIGLIGMFVFRLLVLVRLKRPAAAVISSILLFAYCAFTGAAESSVRAFIMFSCMVLGQAALKTYDPASALSLAGIILLIRSPYTLFRPGFVLSFLAAAALFIIYPLLGKASSKKKKETEEDGDAKEKLPAFIKKTALIAKESCLVWTSVQLATLPAVIFCFYELCPYGLIANIIFVPMTSVVLILSIIGSFVSLLSLPAAVPFMIIPGAVTRLEAAAGDFLKSLPFSRITTGKCGAAFIVLYYAALVIVIYIAVNREKGAKKTAAMLACSILMLGIFIRLPEKTNITALDVGQGDCFVIYTSGGDHFISDGGSSSVSGVGRYRIEPYLKSMGIREVAGIFLSHSDSDHINGIVSLLEDMNETNIDLKIGYIFMTESMKDSEEGKEINTLAEAAGTEIVTLSEGDRVISGEASFKILYSGGESAANDNDASMVFEYSEGWFHALFTGDMGFEPEEEVLNMIEGDITYLKVAHHGSKNSTSEYFLEEISPKISIISAPKKSFYGHPAAETLERIEEAGSVWLQTGLEGAIKTVIEDGGLRISVYK